MPLTDVVLRNIKPGEKRVGISDEKGLYLEVRVGTPEAKTLSTLRGTAWLHRVRL